MYYETLSLLRDRFFSHSKSFVLTSDFVETRISLYTLPIIAKTYFTLFHSPFCISLLNSQLITIITVIENSCRSPSINVLCLAENTRSRVLS